MGSGPSLEDRAADNRRKQSGNVKLKSDIMQNQKDPSQATERERSAWEREINRLKAETGDRGLAKLDNSFQIDYMQGVLDKMPTSYSTAASAPRSALALEQRLRSNKRKSMKPNVGFGFNKQSNPNQGGL